MEHNSRVTAQIGSPDEVASLIASYTTAVSGRLDQEIERAAKPTQSRSPSAHSRILRR
jgi:hypothetical protein